MKTTFQDKHQALENELKIQIATLIKKKGKESKFQNARVLKYKSEVKNYFMDWQNYVAEIAEDKLISHNGYEFAFSTLTLEQLCKIVDSFL